MALELTTAQILRLQRHAGDGRVHRLCTMALRTYSTEQENRRLREMLGAAYQELQRLGASDVPLASDADDYHGA